MSLIRWQPLSEIETLRKQMDRLMDDLFRTDIQNLPSRSIWETTGTPAIEMTETDQELILKAQNPGIESKDLNVEVSEDSVSISGEQKQESRTEEKGYFRSEFHYGRFERTVPLPVTVKNDQVKAEFKNGILILTLPKMETTSRKVVKVALNGQ
jgi:HSP20 family protein